jgi:DNA-binding transcriptional LysR family regulator
MAHWACTTRMSESLAPYTRNKRAGRRARLVTAVDGAISLIAAVEAGQGIGVAPSKFAAVAGRRVSAISCVLVGGVKSLRPSSCSPIHKSDSKA